MNTRSFSAYKIKGQLFGSAAVKESQGSRGKPLCSPGAVPHAGKSPQQGKKIDHTDRSVVGFWLS